MTVEDPNEERLASVQKLRSLRRRLDAQEAPDEDQQALIETIATQELRLRSADASAAAPPVAARLLGGKAEIQFKSTIDMKFIPTAVVNLFSAETDPLVTHELGVSQCVDGTPVKITTVVEGYSYQCVNTVFLEELKPLIVKQLPVFRAGPISELRSLTAAVLLIRLEELGGDGVRLVEEKTVKIWLAPQTTAVLRYDRDANADVTRYLCAWVNPNCPSVLEALSEAQITQIGGYQGNEEAVTAQVRALYEVLQRRAVRYVSTTQAHAPEFRGLVQRVRTPRESLANKAANCIDAAVLFASLVEAATMRPAIVVVPGHAFLAWRPRRANPKLEFLEVTGFTTMGFEAARARGTQIAAAHTALARQLDDPNEMRVFEVHHARAAGIVPFD